METIRDINTKIEEGRLLLIALGRISSLPGYTDKTPDEILAQIAGIAAEVYPDPVNLFAEARRIMGQELLNKTGKGDDCGYRANIAMLIYDNQQKREAAIDLKCVSGCDEMADRIVQLIFS